MSLISLPTMLRAGYDPRLATGVIGASATLAQIIPPSTVLIFVADILQGVNQTAQLRLGNLAPDAGLGRRPVRRRLPAGPAAGRPVPALDGLAAWRDPARCPPLVLPEAERRGAAAAGRRWRCWPRSC